jgi:DNA-binding winged helix-turn-helix (wHTH) protein
MATTLSEPAGGLPAPPLGSRAQFAAGFKPARPDDKLGRLQREVEAVDRANGPAEHEISFGPFRLLPARRLLLEHDKPVRLGSRALDLLIALVERPGELVSKSELIAKVWPDTFVVEGNLKLNIAKLRRALGDGQAGNRYISTVTGRGYCFVAPVTRSVGPCPPTPQRSAAEPSNNVPAPLMRLIGRDEAINRNSAQLWHHRLITLVGPGGIGKTSVAVATAERLTDSYEHGVWFVDLTAISDPRLLPAAVGSAIRLDVPAEAKFAICAGHCVFDDAAGKNRKPAQCPLFFLSQQTIAPVQRSAQRLVSWHGRAAADCRQSEGVVQTRDNPLEPERIDSGRRELDGERYPVKLPADVDDDSCIGGCTA